MTTPLVRSAGHRCSGAACLSATAILFLSACGGSEPAKPAAPKGGTVYERIPESAPAPAATAPVASVQDRGVGKAAEKVVEVLRGTEDEDEIVNLVARLGEYGEAARGVSPRVNDLLSHRSAAVRAAAVEALAAILKGDSASALRLALSDSEPEVRAAAATAFVPAGLTDPAPLHARLREEFDERVQAAIMKSVETISSDSSVEVILECLKDLEPGAVHPALRYLAARKKSDAWPSLLPFLSRADASLRAEVVRFFRTFSLRRRAVVDRLIATLKADKDEKVREEAHKLLKDWTEEDFGYDPNASDEDRAAKAALWRAWFEKNQGELPE